MAMIFFCTRELDQIASGYKYYMQNVCNLDDINNWDLDRLSYEGPVGQKLFRKPKIKLSINLTIRDNFVIEWYPLDENGKNDFLFGYKNIGESSWHNEPYNRLLRINDVDYLNADYIRRGIKNKKN